MGLPGGAAGKEPACQCRRHERLGFDPWVGKMPWRRKWQPTPVFSPGEAQGQKSLEGYSPRGRRESDMTECTRACTRKDNQMIRRLGTEKALGTLMTSLVLSPQDSPLRILSSGLSPAGHMIDRCFGLIFTFTTRKKTIQRRF